MKREIEIFGKEVIEEKVIKQLENCYGDDDIAVLTPDAHYGYSHAVGGAIAYKNHISVSGVGFDIGCGNMCVETNINFNDIENDIPFLMDEIFKRISFGIARINNEKVDHEVFDKINNAKFKPQQKLLNLAKEQLGTVGSGNHYVDLFKDDNDKICIGVHFGSRGFGHKTAMRFIAMSQGLEFTDKGNEGSMDSKPILFDIKSEIGQQYIDAMELAGEYAYAGRETVVNKVLEILGGTIISKVHNHHNFAWKENHFGQDYWVVRKGCTPAFPNQYGFVGSNMFDNSVIIKGVESDDSKRALYSTVHGAGRILSRTQAAGKKKWIKDESGIKKPVIVAKGQVDFDLVKNKMKEHNIALRGAGADEAPECYKSLVDVLGYMKNNIQIVKQLQPIGVCMASSETYDPYKD